MARQRQYTSEAARQAAHRERRRDRRRESLTARFADLGLSAEVVADLVELARDHGTAAAVRAAAIALRALGDGQRAALGPGWIWVGEGGCATVARLGDTRCHGPADER